MRRFAIVPSFVCLLTCALQGQVTVIDVPGATATVVVSINNGGDVTGTFCVTNGNCDSSLAHGFVRQSNGPISTFDGVPTSINDGGTVTGYIFETAGINGFVRDRKGNVTTFGIQPFPPSPAASFGMSINNRGDVAGYIVPCPMCDTYQGFVRNKQGGISTFVGPKGLVPTSINARGDVTGHTAPFYLSEDGFIRDRTGVTFFDVPEAGNSFGPRAYPTSINNRGDVTGYFYDAHRNTVRGFVRDRDGSFSIFDATTDASETKSVAINEKGDVAGNFQDLNGSHQFLRDHHGNITVFVTPNALVGQVAGINNRGDVAGYFLDATLLTHGFVRRSH